MEVTANEPLIAGIRWVGEREDLDFSVFPSARVELDRFVVARVAAGWNFGAARVFQPLMWLFFITAIAVYIWPGHISTGADALEELTGIPWQLSACLGLVIIGAMFTVVKVIYNIVEGLLTFMVGVLVIGSAIVAAMGQEGAPAVGRLVASLAGATSTHR